MKRYFAFIFFKNIRKIIVTDSKLDVKRKLWQMLWLQAAVFPASIYLFKVNNGNFMRECKIWSKLINKKTSERRRWHRSAVFIVNFEHISHLFECFYCWLWESIFLLGLDLLRITLWIFVIFMDFSLFCFSSVEWLLRYIFAWTLKGMKKEH